MLRVQKKLAAVLSFVLLAAVGMPLRAMDMARIETRTDLAVANYGVSGEGVIIAIIDRGIDWKNTDFRNEDGSTRIKYIFDLMDNTGAAAPGNTYGAGTIYTEAQINAALNGGANLATRDAVGHGTSTTGIAAGNGRNLPDRRYRGIAPKASIIAVKFTSEGAPAHDDQPAEAAFYNEAYLIKAMNFVRDKSAELGMPAVMLANFGTINGPTDGTSLLARQIDQTVGPTKPGLVFVTGTGDDGGMPNHAGGFVTAGNTTSIQIEKTTAGLLRMDLWYGGSDRFTTNIVTPSGTFGPYAPPNTGGVAQQTTASYTYYHRGSNVTFYGALNGKREIMIDFNGPVGSYTVNLTGTTVVTGRFDATLNPSRIPSSTNRFLNNVVPGSIIDQATAYNNIAPNSYNIRNTWTDINGIPRQVAGEGAIGDLWLGSSVGPSFDGRMGVDFSAPGDNVFTTYNPTSYWAEFPHNMIQGGGGLYGRAGAVSAAAPQVTGVIALMLEKNPRLNALQVKSILQNSARKDSFTGQTANTIWGHGKMDANEAVRLAQLSARSPDFDFDGDGKSDKSVFRASDSTWYLDRSTAGFSGAQFGNATDKLAPADYDGDGKADIAVWRDTTGEFYALNSSTGAVRSEAFGQPGDIVTSGDWDGDGKADLSVYRDGPQGYFYYRGSLNNPNGAVHYLPWGTSGDKPVRGDFDGDGKQDPVIFRPSTGGWYILQSSDLQVRIQNWGLGTDKLIPADYDGDSKTDLAVYRNGVWYIINSSDGSGRFVTFGIASDTPSAADYDGDGKADIAVFRNGLWYTMPSASGGFTVTSFGTTADSAVPGAFVR
jgi:hypothetical protein